MTSFFGHVCIEHQKFKQGIACSSHLTFLVLGMEQLDCCLTSHQQYLNVPSGVSQQTPTTKDEALQSNHCNTQMGSPPTPGQFLFTDMSCHVLHIAKIK